MYVEPEVLSNNRMRLCFPILQSVYANHKNTERYITNLYSSRREPSGLAIAPQILNDGGGCRMVMNYANISKQIDRAASPATVSNVAAASNDLLLNATAIRDILMCQGVKRTQCRPKPLQDICPSGVVST